MDQAWASSILSIISSEKRTLIYYHCGLLIFRAQNKVVFFVLKVLPRFAPGTSSMKCNMYTASDDTVGSFEERMTDLLKRQFPHEPRLVSFQAASRSGAAFLWYPDDKALAQSTIKFV